MIPTYSGTIGEKYFNVVPHLLRYKMIPTYSGTVGEKDFNVVQNTVGCQTLSLDFIMLTIQNS